jgi:hypothetical protein
MNLFIVGILGYIFLVVVSASLMMWTCESLKGTEYEETWFNSLKTFGLIYLIGLPLIAMIWKIADILYTSNLT